MINKKDRHTLEKFGLHVKKLREQKGMSLRELSYVCAIDNSKISKIEQGKVNLTLLTLLELATGLDIPPQELTGFLKM